MTVAAVSLGAGLIAGPVFADKKEKPPLECSVIPQSICKAADEGKLENSGIWELLILAVNIMTAGVGIAAVGAIVFAGFLYTGAQDDPGQVKKAMEIIRNTVIGLIAYALMYAAINFLVPGGVFSYDNSSNTKVAQTSKEYVV